MKKVKFFGSYIPATGYGFRGVAVAVLAGVLCLVGPAIDKTFAGDKNDIFKSRPFPGTSSFPGERKAFPGTGSFPSERPDISFEISDKELTGNMDKYLARKASVNKYLAWKASVNEYLAWKANVSEYLAWKANVNEYLAHKASVNEYLAWKANVNEYLAWKASVNEQINNSNASAPAQESGFWKDRRDKKKKDPKKGYSVSASDQDTGESASSEAGGGGAALQAPAPTSFLRGDVNQDGQVSVQDAKVLLNLIFNAGYEPLCLESADVNNDGMVLANDAIQIISFAVRGMAPPAKPFPACNKDDERSTQLGCDYYDACPSGDGS
jgi:hypothetical protein